VNGWRRRGGLLVAQLSEREAGLLRGMVGHVRDMLGARVAALPPDELAELTGITAGPTTPPADRVLARLLPDFHRDDATLSGGLRALHEPELLAVKDGAAGVACAAEGKGYPFFVFQQFLLKLKREGVLLAFCSKNNRQDVIPVFDTLRLPLALADFSAWRCDWQSKSSGILSIARELNVAPDALIVVDDNDAERAEIRHGVPDAEVVATPRDGREWRGLFERLQERCGTGAVSDEDRGRSESFAHERLRRGARAAEPVSVERANDLSYLRDLQLTVTIREQAFDDPRSIELVNRTNQFNLTGERFASDQWLDWAAVPGAFCWSARLTDRFGDFGTICVVTGRVDGATAQLRQFVLSCRALGRGVETIVLGELCARLGVRELRGPFQPTGRNEPAQRFLAALGAGVESAGEWRLDASAVRAARDAVVLQTGAAGASAPPSRSETTA